MNILNELEKRGILNNVTSKEKISKIPLGTGVYAGFDPTAESLHLGNYIQISVLKKFAEAGFSPVAVLGGATGMIGDPSGKSQERNLLDNKVLINNKNKIRKQLENQGLKVVDNLDFYKDMNVLDFLRDVGKHLNINYMINKDVVKSRLETGISFTEFSYQLIQGWDFKSLYDDHNVMMQIGGSDQWGNITAGIELIRKTIGDDNLACGVTTNLMTTSDGKKFGKSAGNALFLDPKLTSPFSIYQYLLNTPDSDVEKLFLWLTSFSISDISNIMKDHNIKPKLRKAQKKLAFAIVSDLHGSEEANNVLVLSDVLFSGGSISNLSSKQVLSLGGAIPTMLGVLGNIQDVLVKVNAAKSKREAREFISAGAVNINGEIIMDDSFEIKPIAFDRKATIIKRGKKKFFLIKY